jgi:H+/Cl- antiporter ClcA
LAVGFGSIVGFYGAFLNAALLYTLERLRRITDHLGWASISITVGGVTGLLVALFADATGGGEMLATQLITVEVPAAPLVVLLLARTLLFLVNYGTGTPGGFLPRNSPSERCSGCCSPQQSMRWHQG